MPEPQTRSVAHNIADNLAGIAQRISALTGTLMHVNTAVTDFAAALSAPDVSRAALFGAMHYGARLFFARMCLHIGTRLPGMIAGVHYKDDAGNLSYEGCYRIVWHYLGFSHEHPIATGRLLRDLFSDMHGAYAAAFGAFSATASGDEIREALKSVRTDLGAIVGASLRSDSVTGHDDKEWMARYVSKSARMLLTHVEEVLFRELLERRAHTLLGDNVREGFVYDREVAGVLDAHAGVDWRVEFNEHYVHYNDARRAYSARYGAADLEACVCKIIEEWGEQSPDGRVHGAAPRDGEEE